MGFTPRRTSGNFDRTTFPLGENIMTLTKLMAFWSEPSEWKPEGQLTFFLIWEDADGDEFTEFPSAPKGFGYNEKSTFWNRIAALAGKTGFEDEDLERVSLDLPGMDDYSNGDPVAFFIQASLQGESGEFIKDSNERNLKVPFDVSYDGESLLGRRCRLIMGERRNKKGELQEGNKVAQAGALPLQTGGGKKKGGAAVIPPASAPSHNAMP